LECKERAEKVALELIPGGGLRVLHRGAFHQGMEHSAEGQVQNKAPVSGYARKGNALTFAG
jgi:hypothetical protein